MKSLMFRTATFASLVFFLVQGEARADGFFCEGQMTGHKITLMNYSAPSAGTRKPEYMLVTDPNRSPVEQKLVNFTEHTKALNYVGYGAFLGRVDQSILQTSRADAVIAGIAIRQLKSVLVDIRFAYDPATMALARIAKSIPGKVTYTQTNGETREEKLTCTRYLKSARN